MAWLGRRGAQVLRISEEINLSAEQEADEDGDGQMAHLTRQIEQLSRQTLTPATALARSRQPKRTAVLWSALLCCGLLWSAVLCCGVLWCY